MSALPSPFVSRIAIRKPPAGGLSLLKYSPLQVFAKTVPSAPIARCRAWPIPSAKIVAQKPGGSARPLFESQFCVSAPSSLALCPV